VSAVGGNTTFSRETAESDVGASPGRVVIRWAGFELMHDHNIEEAVNASFRLTLCEMGWGDLARRNGQQGFCLTGRE
jgi:hypothetical protein